MSGKGIKKSHMGHAPRQEAYRETSVFLPRNVVSGNTQNLCCILFLFPASASYRLQLRTGSQHVDADNLLKKLSCCFLESKSAHHGSVANRVGIRDLLASCNIATNLRQAQ